MRSGDRAGAQLSESAGKLRGAAAARSAARVARSGQRRLHAQSGRRASFGPSPAPRAPGRGGAAAGVPSARGRPSLHRGSPRAHWPRRGDHRGGVPYRPPLSPPRTPRARPGRGGGGGGSGPARTGQPADGARRGASATQPAPAAERSAVYRIARAGWGRGAGEEAGAGREPQRHSRGESGLHSPGGGARSLATAALRLAGQDAAGLRRIREALSPQGISHNHQSTAGD